MEAAFGPDPDLQHQGFRRLHLARPCEASEVELQNEESFVDQEELLKENQKNKKY